VGLEVYIEDALLARSRVGPLNEHGLAESNAGGSVPISVHPQPKRLDVTSNCPAVVPQPMHAASTRTPRALKGAVPGICQGSCEQRSLDTVRPLFVGLPSTGVPSRGVGTCVSTLIGTGGFLRTIED
jgi:hypothetical protein